MTTWLGLHNGMFSEKINFLSGVVYELILSKKFNTKFQTYETKFNCNRPVTNETVSC